MSDRLRELEKEMIEMRAHFDAHAELCDKRWNLLRWLIAGLVALAGSVAVAVLEL